jgi:uncharacterized protein (TIGR02271 family)
MRTVIGVFSDKAEAELAIVELEGAGARASEISVLAPEPIKELADIQMKSLNVEGHGRLGASGPLSTFLTQSTAASSPDAIVGALTRMGLPLAYAQSYVDAVSRGLTFEAVLVPDEKADEALGIMQAHTQPSRTEEHAAQLAGDAAANAILPVVVEELEVGKREVGIGGVRVTSKVTETPVEEDIRLRTERIDVERRAADRPIADTEKAFEERTIDVIGTSEEPVVAKRAHVIEEIIVRKDVDIKTETIRDTVRRTDVEIETIPPFDLSKFEGHFNTTYAKDTTYGFDAYVRAYRFGHAMSGDRRFAGATWEEVEPNARAAWEEKNPGTWERFKVAVEHAWQRTKNT